MKHTHSLGVFKQRFNMVFQGELGIGQHGEPVMFSPIREEHVVLASEICPTRSWPAAETIHWWPSAHDQGKDITYSFDWRSTLFRVLTAGLCLIPCPCWPLTAAHAAMLGACQCSTRLKQTMIGSECIQIWKEKEKFKYDFAIASELNQKKCSMSG